MRTPIRMISPCRRPRCPAYTGFRAAAASQQPRSAQASGVGSRPHEGGPPRTRLRRDRPSDEELLVQRAAEIELVTADRGVRKALVRAAIDAAVRDAAAHPPSERELRSFHAEHAARFARPSRARVRAITFDASRDPDA